MRQRSNPIASAIRFARARVGSGAAGGWLLIAAAAALIVANSPLAAGYRAVLHAPLGPLTVHQWIDDALMALFFFVVGLEVKRAFLVGALSRPGTRLLPVSAALAGMAAPAIVYLLVTGGGGLARGWAVPAATDIAFAQTVLLLAAPHAPPALRLFLTTLAIIDDLGAVAIIAIGYTARIDPTMLVAAAAILGVMALLARRGVDRAWPYALLAILLWIAVHRSGVHATVAGVLAALTIPIRPQRAGAPALAAELEHRLSPWVTFAIVPLFGFANAGLSLDRTPVSALLHPLPLGIAAGLFLGKQIGVGLGIAVPIRIAGVRRPEGVGIGQLYGVALLAGIGFTMSLFIGGLAFADPAMVEDAKLGTLAGSLLSAIAGYLVLRLSSPRGA